MGPVLSNSRLWIREQVGLFRAENHYDVYDPETGQLLLECREKQLTPFWKCVRLGIYRKTPFDIRVRTPDGRPVLRVHRGPALVRAKVAVRDANDQVLAYLRSRFFTVVEKFDVLGPDDRKQHVLARSWKGRDFFLLSGRRRLAQIHKKWSGWGRELFTSADAYELTISPDVPPGDPLRLIALAAVLAIDMLLYE